MGVKVGLAFAGSMGGMLTLIGTPPNLIVRDVLVGAGYEPLGFFSFTPIGIVCIVVGTALLIPLSRRFLKGRTASASSKSGKSLQQLAEEYRLAEGLHCLQIPESSSMVGHTLKQLDVRRNYGVTIIEVRRSSLQGGALRKLEQFAIGNRPLSAGDVLYATGSEEQIKSFATALQLNEMEDSPAEGGALNFYDVGMAEILVLPASSLVGQTVEQAGFRSTYRLNVLGIRRHNDYLLDDIKDQRIHASDIVLVQGRWKNIAKLNARDGQEWVVVGQPLEQAAKVTLDYKAPIAALIMLLMVLVMAFDFIPIAPVTAVMLAAVAMIFTGCLRSVEAAYKTINWESIILFGAMLPMSTALEKTGTSQLISQSLVHAVGGHGGMLLIACIYVATSFMTFFISNTVTAVLMAPIALQAAQAEGLKAVPVLMAVTVAASMCFASPFSTPPNALVLSAGGYKPIDYVKVGLPLQVAIGIVMVVGLGLWA